MRLGFLATIIFAACTSTGTAAEYRVDSQEAFDALRSQQFLPGDTIRFQRGKRFTGMFAPTGSGSAQAPIVVDSYGQGQLPRIDAGGQFPAAVMLRNVSYWEINDLEVTNTDGTDRDQGTLFGIYGLIERQEGVFRHIHIDGCHVHDVNGLVAGKRRGGIHVHIVNCTKARIDDLRITNNRINRIGGVGIGNDSSCGLVYVRATPVITRNLWTNVYVAKNFVDHTGRNNVIARVSKDAIYEYNTLANSSRFDTGHSIFCFRTDGIRIQHNEAYGNVGAEDHDRGGFDADFNCANTFIQYNYSHDNMWFCGIMKRPNRDVVIRYNITQNERVGLYFYGFDEEQDAKNIHIYNNTHYTRRGLKVNVFPEKRTPLNSRFENNIFYFEEKGWWGNDGKEINTHFNNNLYFNIDPHPSDNHHAIVADPEFTKAGHAGTHIDMVDKGSLLGFRLHPDSPAIGRGVTLEQSKPKVDFFGRPVPTKLSLGASQ